jgi:hypothetical protein
LVRIKCLLYLLNIGDMVVDSPSKAKVSYFQKVSFNEDIGWFQVSMDESIRMDVFHCL